MISRHLIWMCFFALACNDTRSDLSFPAPTHRTLADYHQSLPDTLTESVYLDKMLGLLVGSAIGDAMGAPTEMWPRQDIVDRYGFVTDFTRLDRPRSPEGPWQSQMRSGATTDDTRWKWLTGQFLLEQNQAQLDGKRFAQYILQQFRREAIDLSEASTATAISDELTHVTWLQEWALVATPYAEGNMMDYHIALNKFYGGEMSCAGMLYAPLIGACYPANPQLAYLNTYELALFDLGYARDISGLTGAYVAAALNPELSYDELLGLSETIDPYNYLESRLIGRLAHQYAETANTIVHAATTKSPASIGALPQNFPYGRSQFDQLQEIYQAMDAHQKDIAFHAGEIHFINLAALHWSGGDFSKAMEFVTNYGRDNDTVGAVTGAILGAYHGASHLPEKQVQHILELTRDHLGIDLQHLARQLVSVLPR